MTLRDSALIWHCAPSPVLVPGSDLNLGLHRLSMSLSAVYANPLNTSTQVPAALRMTIRVCPGHACCSFVKIPFFELVAFQPLNSAPLSWLQKVYIHTAHLSSPAMEKRGQLENWALGKGEMEPLPWQPRSRHAALPGPGLVGEIGGG